MNLNKPSRGLDKVMNSFLELIPESLIIRPESLDKKEFLLEFRIVKFKVLIFSGNSDVSGNLEIYKIDNNNREEFYSSFSFVQDEDLNFYNFLPKYFRKKMPKISLNTFVNVNSDNFWVMYEFSILFIKSIINLNLLNESQ